MENEPNEQALPIAQPEPVLSAPQGDGPSSMMARFEAMKAAKEAEPAAQTQAISTEATEAEPAATAIEPQATTTDTPPKEKLKWGELKAKATRADELEAKLPTLEKELAELREKAATLEAVDPTRFQKQIEEKEAKIAAYEKKIAIHDIRESEQWRNEVQAPMMKIGTDLERIAAAYGVKAVDLKDALVIADPAAQLARINDLTSDMSELHKNKIWTAVEKTQELYETAQRMEDNAEAARKELEFLNSQQTEKQKQEQQQKLSIAAKTVQQQYREKLPFLFEDEETANKIFGADLNLSNNPQWQTYRAYAGEALPILNAKLAAQTSRVAELEKELASRAAVGVRAGGGNATVGQPAAEATRGQYEGSTVFERAKHAAALGHISGVVTRLG
jgi:ribosomal protein L29